jgi:hypothetical protein
MIDARLDASRIMAAHASAIRGLRELTGFQLKDILKAEAGSILKTWAGRTKVGTQAQADRRTRYRTVRDLGYGRAEDRGDVSVNSTFRPAPYGRVWIKVRNGNGRQNYILAMGPNFTQPTGKAVFNKFHPNPSPTTNKWIANVLDATEDVQATVNRRLEAGRRSRALARQSVVQIADRLGIDLSKVAGGGVNTAGLAKARAAMASTGRFYQNGFAASGGDNAKSFIDLINRLPYGREASMDRTLLGVIAGRGKLFERFYASRVIHAQHATARAFPNVMRVARTSLP